MNQALGTLVRDELGVYRRVHEDGGGVNSAIVKQNLVFRQEIRKLEAQAEEEQRRVELLAKQLDKVKSQAAAHRSRADQAERQVRAVESRYRDLLRVKAQEAEAHRLDSERAMAALAGTQSQAEMYRGISRVSQQAARQAGHGLIRRLRHRDDTINQLQRQHEFLVGHLGRAYYLVSRDHAETTRRLAALGRAGIATPVTTPGPTVEYVLTTGWDIVQVRGATTSEPNDQRMLDVYALIRSLLGGLIGTWDTPHILGSAPGGLPIFVEQGSDEEKALAAFPTFVQKVS